MMESFFLRSEPNSTFCAHKISNPPEIQNTSRNSDNGNIFRQSLASVKCDTDTGRSQLSNTAKNPCGPSNNARGRSSDEISELVDDLNQVTDFSGNNSDGNAGAVDGNSNKVRCRDKLIGAKRKPRSASASFTSCTSSRRSRKRSRSYSEGCRNDVGRGCIDNWLIRKPRAHGHDKAKKKRKRLAKSARGFALEILKTVQPISLTNDCELFPVARLTRRRTEPLSQLPVDFNADEITSIIVRAAVKWIARLLHAIKIASRRTVPGCDDLVYSDDRRLLHFEAMRRHCTIFDLRPAFRSLPNPKCLFSDHVYAALPLLFDDPTIVPLGRSDPIRCRLIKFMEFYGQVQDHKQRRTTSLRIPSYDLFSPHVQNFQAKMRQNFVLRQVLSQWHRLI